MNLTEKLRSGHVRRWHIVAVAREQTVAEHMHRVGVITEEILRVLGYFSWNSNLTLNAMRWAAIHDRHEYLLGDLPTPGKERIRAEIERAHGPRGVADVFDSLVEDIDPEAEQLRQCVHEGGECPLAGDIVKYADLLEAMNYVGIFGCGSHAAQVHFGLVQAATKAYAKIVERDGLDFDRAAELHMLIDQLKEGHHWL